MMLVIVSVALFFPRRLDNAGPSASSSVMPAPIPATIVQVPVIADAPPVQRRTTVTATLAMPAESAPAPRPLHADAPVAPGQPPSTSHPPSVQAIVPLDGADVQPAPVTASSAADAESPPTAAAPMQGTMVSPSSPPSASTSMADGRNATKTPAIASDTPTAAKEPDPGDIIDWLMKKKPAPGGSRTHDGAP
jgi:translation initiation factor IF-2